ncbi:MAG: malate dehydrogenase [Propionibacteriaceae bacterium]|nr:malate dehydrogenase [Propionibacteriaceae bacterium]
MKNKAPVKIAITGAAGRVAYDLLFQIASGAMLGPNTLVELRLLDLPATMTELEGRAMELHDCAFKTLDHVETGSDAKTMFDGVNFALLVAGKPRKAGMDRSDLLRDNGALFKLQGEALNDVAADDVKVLVTGNPANTNCAIASAHAPDIPKEQFSALTRLDHDRAIHRLGKKLNVNVSSVTHMSIWGNHSSTMFPDIFHAEVDGENAWEQIDDMDWLVNKYLPDVANRGSTIISKRGSSSAASAANATLSAMRDWSCGTSGEWVSMSVATDGSYGVPEGLYCSFPVTVDANGNYHVVEGIKHNEFAQARISMSVQELVSEHEAIKSLGLI